MGTVNDSLHRENIEWCDLWVSGAAGTDLPRALLVGDSITRAYYDAVAKQLSGRYACARLATSRCVGDPVLLKELDLVLAEYEYEVIHFNNGMHGWDYTEDEYAKGLASVMDELIARAPKGRIIWANTTPVHEGEGFEGLEAKRTDRVRERNRIADGFAAERGMVTNDFFSLMIDHPEYHCDGVHFNDEGKTAMGAQVVEMIAG